MDTRSLESQFYRLIPFKFFGIAPRWRLLLALVVAFLLPVTTCVAADELPPSGYLQTGDTFFLLADSSFTSQEGQDPPGSTRT